MWSDGEPLQMSVLRTHTHTHTERERPIDTYCYVLLHMCMGHAYTGM